MAKKTKDETQGRPLIKRIGDTAAEIVDNTKRIVKKNLGDTQSTVDYSSKEARETTLDFLRWESQTERQRFVDRWIRNDNYYHGKHDTMAQLAAFCEEKQIPFIPAAITDVNSHVEAMIVPELPDFIFYGRDNDLDSAKARQRQYAVQYVLENNRVSHMIPVQERRVNKFGLCMFKVCFDLEIPYPDSKDGGDILVIPVEPGQFFPDYQAKSWAEMDNCIYEYPLSCRRAQRKFRKQLIKLGKSIYQMGVRSNDASETRVLPTDGRTVYDDMVTIDELYYINDDGDVAMSVYINGEEVQHVERYWEKTGDQNKRFPFVMISKIESDNEFWPDAIIDAIIPLVDEADREVAYGILNDAFAANDIVLVEEDTFASGQEMVYAPGQVWKLAKGALMANKTPKRLGGLAEFNQRIPTIEYFQNQIEKTIGNYESSMGMEPTRVTTASGIAQLNERADARKGITTVQRLNGYEQLFELIDWTVLEFFDDDRLIYIGAPGHVREANELKANDVDPNALKMVQGVVAGRSDLAKNMDPGKGPVMFRFSSKNHAVKTADGMKYYPRVDCMIHAGDGLRKSKAYTLAFLENLLGKVITADNYKLVCAMIRISDLPERKEIISYIEERFKKQAEAADGAVDNVIKQNELESMQLDGMLPLDVTPEMQAVIDQLAQDPEQAQWMQENPQELEAYLRQMFPAQAGAAPTEDPSLSIGGIGNGQEMQTE